MSSATVITDATTWSFIYDNVGNTMYYQDIVGSYSDPVTNVPTRARNVADVSGAGDTVISTLTAALMGGATNKEAVTLANYAAGIVCEDVGIIPIELNKLRKACIG